MVFWKNVFFLDMFVLFFKEQLWKILKAWEVDSSWNCDIKSATILISCHVFGSFRAWRGEFHRPHWNEMYLKFCVGVLPSDTSQRRPFEAWVMLIMVIFYAIMLVYITARRLVRKTANIWPCTTEQLSSYLLVLLLEFDASRFGCFDVSNTILAFFHLHFCWTFLQRTWLGSLLGTSWYPVKLVQRLVQKRLA